MRRSDVIMSGLAICAIGVTLWTIPAVGPGWGIAIALLGALVAVGGLFVRDAPSPPIRDRDAEERADTRQRLLTLAQAALDLAATSRTDEEFGDLFYDAWRHEQLALAEFLQTRYGLKIRGWWLTSVPHLDQVTAFSEALQEAARELDSKR